MSSKTKITFISDDEFQKGKAKIVRKTKYSKLVKFVKDNRDRGWCDIVLLVEEFLPEMYEEIKANNLSLESVTATCVMRLRAVLKNRKMGVSIKQSNAVPSGYGIRFLQDKISIAPIKTASHPMEKIKEELDPLDEYLKAHPNER